MAEHGMGYLPDPEGAEAFVQPPAPSVRYIAGAYNLYEVCVAVPDINTGGLQNKSIIFCIQKNVPASGTCVVDYQHPGAACIV